MAESQSTVGIILRKIPYGENDLIVHALAESGRLFSFMAKSAKNSQKRFAGGLDLFNLSNFSYQENNHSQLHRLLNSELMVEMGGARKDLIKFAAACYFAEIILEFMQENESAPELYKMLLSFLNAINECDSFDIQLIPLLEHELLTYFGYKPTLHHCIICQKNIEPNGSYYFNSQKGGVICSLCNQVDKSSRLTSEHYPLSYSAITKIVNHKLSPQSSTDKLLWNTEEVTEMRQALEFFLQYTAGKPFKSLQFLTSVLS